MQIDEDQLRDRAAHALDKTHFHKNADKGKLNIARAYIAKYLDENFWTGKIFLKHLATVERAGKIRHKLEKETQNATLCGFHH